MKKGMDAETENWLQAALARQQTDALSNCNEVTAAYGLTLSQEDCALLLDLQIILQNYCPDNNLPRNK